MLPWVVSVARVVRRTILTNLMWAFGYNLVALTLAALGLLQPILAAAVMASSSLLLVVNSLRLSRLPDPVPAPTPGAADPVPSRRRARRGVGVPAMARPCDRASADDRASAEHVVREGGVPADRLVRGLAADLGAFADLADEGVDGLELAVDAAGS